MAAPRPRRRALAAAEEIEYDRVLFFSDAVFAIAITLLVVDLQVPEVPNLQAGEQLRESIPQVTGYMAREHSGHGVAQGLLLLALLWWTWSAYAWLGNQARVDEGVLRVGMAVAMAAIFAVALTIPEAWHDAPGALGVEGVLAHAEETRPLGGFYAAALFGGAALYLAGYLVFKQRMVLILTALVSFETTRCTQTRRSLRNP